MMIDISINSKRLSFGEKDFNYLGLKSIYHLFNSKNIISFYLNNNGSNQTRRIQRGSSGT